MYDSVYDSTLVSVDDDDAIPAPENPMAAPPREAAPAKPDAMIGFIPAAVLARLPTAKAKATAEAEERPMGANSSV